MAIDNILDMFSKSIHILLTSLAFLLFSVWLLKLCIFIFLLDTIAWTILILSVMVSFMGQLDWP